MKCVTESMRVKTTFIPMTSRALSRIYFIFKNLKILYTTCNSHYFKKPQYASLKSTIILTDFPYNNKNHLYKDYTPR